MDDREIVEQYVKVFDQEMHAEIQEHLSPSTRPATCRDFIPDLGL